MGLDGLVAEKQLGRDLAVGQAVGDEVGDLALALRERADARVVRRRGARAAPRAHPACAARAARRRERDATRIARSPARPRAAPRSPALRSSAATSARPSASRENAACNVAPDRVGRIDGRFGGLSRRLHVARREQRRRTACAQRPPPVCASPSPAAVSSAITAWRSASSGRPIASSAIAMLSQLKQRSTGIAQCRSSSPSCSTIASAAGGIPALQVRRRLRPARPAARRRHRSQRELAIADPLALLACLDRGRQVARVVARPRDLEQRPEQVVRVRGQPRDLDRRLRGLERLRDPPLHLERVALDQQERHQEPALARRARQLEPTLRVRHGVVVALEVVLGPAEVVERVEAPRKLGLRQPLELGDRELAMLLGQRGLPLYRGGQRERRGRGHHQPSIVEAARRRKRVARHGDRMRMVHRVEAVDGELDLQDGGLRRVAVGQVLPCARRAGGGRPDAGPANARPRRTSPSAPRAARRPAAEAGRARRAASCGSARARPTRAARMPAGPAP